MAPFLTLKTFHIPHLRKSCQSTKTWDLTWSPKPTWKFLTEENWSSWGKYPLSALRSKESVAQKWNPEGPSVQFSSVQSLSCVWLFATPWTAAHQASLSITNSQSLLKLMSIESVMPSNHLILCHPLLLPPSIFPSIRVFSNESVLRIRWPKYWSFTFSISPSNEYSGLISFRIDWLDLLAVQGTLKILLRHHSSKASVLQRSAFLIQKGHRSCLFSPGGIQHLLYLSSFS